MQTPSPARFTGRRFEGSSTCDKCGSIITDYLAYQHANADSCIGMDVLDGDTYIRPILPHLVQHFVARVVEMPPNITPGLVGDYLFEIQLACLNCFCKDWDLKIVGQYLSLKLSQSCGTKVPDAFVGGRILWIIFQ
ncbi:hypothetical protein V2K16_21815 [Pseudomonas alliivorans]|uniref:hypothetical protein n=1 Tax=Pseudomonas TaxID=286 RepID=UPI001A910CA2|nr:MULTISPECIES: hypothetical protein [Pseudomonas]MBP0942723.1 hypothetical protein [Pseudomonas alliivorans]MEE4880818.1 hypothetical protein [Pseudomonas alliivorans]MEE4932319.1 hypothetical protein [Pseudomonas alliivorans]MEE4937703.1 hypothetical protein [Pseudomonas alliivorans]MEE4942861.1 hypothetical protein [Pseudomonas alliivorans]